MPTPQKNPPKLSQYFLSASLGLLHRFQDHTKGVIPSCELGVQWHTLTKNLTSSRLGCYGEKLSRGRLHSCRSLILLSGFSLPAVDFSASGLLTQLGEKALVMWGKIKEDHLLKNWAQCGRIWLLMFMVCYKIFLGYDRFLVCLIFYYYYFLSSPELIMKTRISIYHCRC